MKNLHIPYLQQSAYPLFILLCKNKLLTTIRKNKTQEKTDLKYTQHSEQPEYVSINMKMFCCDVVSELWFVLYIFESMINRNHFRKGLID